MQYLPFNQLPVTKSKGFSDEEGDKTRISLFCPFHVGNDWRKTERKKKKNSIKTTWGGEETGDTGYFIFDAQCYIMGRLYNI